MLDSIRNAARSWLVKALMALLVLSFALWGVNDVFNNADRGALIEAGRTTVSAQEFQSALERSLRPLRQQLGQNFSREHARMMAYNLRTRFSNSALLDEQARRMGLGRSARGIIGSFLEEANIGPDELSSRLFNSGMSEAQFLANERAASLRGQLIAGLTEGVTAPGVLVDAVHRFNSETRKVAYIRFGPEAAGEIPEPSQEALQSFYDENKARFRAPEYRTISVMDLNLGTLAKSIEVSDEDARALYDGQQQQYVTPERRAIDQMVFENEEQARAASERITSGGATYEAVAAERNLTPEQLSLGTLTRDGIVDDAVAEAAFGLAKGAVSGPVATGFGTVLLRVREIEQKHVKPFEEVKDQIKTEIARDRAAGQISQMFGQVDDMRAGGASLDDIGAQYNLEVRHFEMIDAESKGPDGKPIENAPAANVVAAAFQTDPGVEANAIQVGRDGYIWYDVAKVIPERDRPLDEVREEAVRLWKEQETRKRVADLAKAAEEEIKGGKTLEAVAGERSLEVKQAGPFKRTETPEPFSASAVSTVFATPQEGIGQAVGQDGTSRLVFRVGEVALPAIAEDARGSLVTRAEGAISNDLLIEYVSWLQEEIGVRINEEMFGRLFGGQTS